MLIWDHPPPDISKTHPVPSQPGWLSGSGRIFMHIGIYFYLQLQHKVNKTKDSQVHLYDSVSIAHASTLLAIVVGHHDHVSLLFTHSGLLRQAAAHNCLTRGAARSDTGTLFTYP